jgi:hypothetical protein
VNVNTRDKGGAGPVDDGAMGVTAELELDEEERSVPVLTTPVPPVPLDVLDEDERGTGTVVEDEDEDERATGAEVEEEDEEAGRATPVDEGSTAVGQLARPIPRVGRRCYRS